MHNHAVQRDSEGRATLDIIASIKFNIIYKSQWKPLLPLTAALSRINPPPRGPVYLKGRSIQAVDLACYDQQLKQGCTRPDPEQP